MIAVAVVDFDAVVCHEAQSAMQTAARLVLEQSYYSVRFGGVSCEAVYPVWPIAVVGAFRCLDFDVPLDGCVGVQAQAGFPVREFHAAAAAMPVPKGDAIALFAPGVALAGVLPFGPFA